MDKKEMKFLHESYVTSIGRKQVFWQSQWDVKGETGSEIIAAHEQALWTKCHATNIFQTETQNKGWLRQELIKIN